MRSLIHFIFIKKEHKIITKTLYRFHLFLIFICISCFVGQSQSLNTFFDSTTLKKYAIKRYTNDNGLKQNIIDQLYMDEYNFLWMSTPSGLVRFDGSKFKYFNSGLGDDSRIFRIRPYNNEDDSHIVLFTNGVQGIIKEGKFENLNTLDTNFVWGSQWYFFHHGLSNPISNDLYTKVDPNQYNHDSFPIFFSLNNEEHFVQLLDSVYYYKKGQLIHSYYDNKLNNYTINLSSYLTPFILDKSIFILREDFSILEFNTKGETKIHSLIKDLVLSEGSTLKNKDLKFKILTKPSRKNPTLYYKNRFYTINYHNGKLKLQQLEFTMNNPFGMKIEFSATGEDIFISTSYQGLYHLKKKKFTNSSDFDPNSSFPMSTHIETDIGNILTSEPGQIVDGKHIPHPCLFKSKSFIKTKDGNIFAHSANDIQLIHTANQICSTIYSDKNVVFEDLTLDENSNLWYCGKKAIEQEIISFLGFLTPDFEDTRINLNLPLIWSINTTPQGTIQLNGEEQIYFYTQEKNQLDSIKNPIPLEIRNAYYLNDSISLLATYNDGLYYSNGEEVKKLVIENNKINASSCIIKDSLSYVWVTSNNGLFRFKEENIIKKVVDEGFKLHYTFYSIEDGIINNEFNGDCYPCANVLSNGSLSFPTMHGLTYVDPLSVNKSIQHIPKIIIQPILDGEEIQTPTDIKISPDTKRIEFDLFTSNYDSKENLHLFYRLKGYDEAWISYSDDKSISYTNLNPGNYRFDVMLVREENEYFNQINFTVLKKWHQTHLALFIFGVLLIAFIYLVVVIRVRYLKSAKEKLEREVTLRTKELHENIEILNTTKADLTSAVQTKNKLLGIISHEIVGGIHMIKNISELSLEKKGDPSQVDLSVMQDINVTAQNTSKILDQILLWVKNQNKGLSSKAEPIKLYEIVNTIIRQLEAFSKKKGIQWVNHIDQDHEFLSYKTNLLLILHSLLENEVKYNSDARIQLHLKENLNQVTIEIVNENDGGTLDVDTANLFFEQDMNKEMSSSSLIKGLGFLIVKDLLQNMKGSILFKRPCPKSHTILLTFLNEKKLSENDLLN